MQYTVHRALTMIKTIKARIFKELDIDAPAWVRVSLGQDDHISGVPIKEIQKEIQSGYDRVTALIENYIKIKSAVIQSNAGVSPDAEVKKISVAGKSLTVAEIIELIDTVYVREKKSGFKSALLFKMKMDYSQATKEFDKAQQKADEKVDQYLQVLMGNKKDSDNDDDKTKSLIESTGKMLHEKQAPHLVDPLKIADKIQAFENEIEEFRTEADAVLSEQNALTLIEVNLAEIK